jgi:phosphatidylglycerol:prolipoprotein diacylglycerol transferase
VAFPEGLPATFVPVHPTQLYEAICLVPLALLLMRWRRQGVADDVVIGRYCLGAGAIRFAIEFIRINRRLVGPLTLAHLISLTVVIVGAMLVMRSGRKGPSLSMS